MVKEAISEDIPPLDQISGLPLPHEQDSLYGHDQAEQTLLTSYQSERLHHAWLIGGPRGIGKATLAFRFARFMLAYPHRFSDNCKNANSLTDLGEFMPTNYNSILSHPNVLHLARPWNQTAKQYRNELTVDEIRRTIPFFGTTAGQDGWRICIVDAADEMNLNAANALLKILEEPPEQAIFLVLAHAPGRLLPTIRSRCRRLDLKPLDEENLFLALEKYNMINDLSDNQINLVAQIAEGSVRRAATLLANDGIKIAEDFENLFKQLPETNTGKMLAFAETISARNAVDNYELFQDLVRANIRKLIHQGIEKSVPLISLVNWTKVWEKTNESVALADEYNLDKKQVIINTFNNLSETLKIAGIEKLSLQA